MDWPLSQIGAAAAFKPSQGWYVKLGGYEVNPHNALTSNGVRIFPKGTSRGHAGDGGSGLHHERRLGR